MRMAREVGLAHSGSMNSDTVALEQRLVEGAVLAVFTARWAVAGRVLVRTLEESLSTRKDVTLVTVDVDEYPHLADRFQILSVPTVAVLGNGLVRERSAGAIGAAEVLAMLEEVAL